MPGDSTREPDYIVDRVDILDRDPDIGLDVLLGVDLLRNALDDGAAVVGAALLPVLDQLAVLARQEQDGLPGLLRGRRLLDNAADRADTSVLIDRAGQDHIGPGMRPLDRRDHQERHQRTGGSAVDGRDLVLGHDRDDHIRRREVRPGSLRGDMGRRVRRVLEHRTHQGRRVDQYPPPPGLDIDGDIQKGALLLDPLGHEWPILLLDRPLHHGRGLERGRSFHGSGSCVR